MEGGNIIAQAIVVANTGPIISAFQCDKTSVLQALFQAVHVPASALAEYEKHGIGNEVRGLIRNGFFKTHKLWPWEQRRAQALSQQIAVSSLSRDPVPSSHGVDAEAIVLAQRRVIGAHYG